MQNGIIGGNENQKSRFVLGFPKTRVFTTEMAVLA